MFTVTPDVDGGTRKAAAGAVTASAAINSTAAAAPGGSLEDWSVLPGHAKLSLTAVDRRQGMTRTKSSFSISAAASNGHHWAGTGPESALRTPVRKLFLKIFVFVFSKSRLFFKQQSWFASWVLNRDIFSSHRLGYLFSEKLPRIWVPGSSDFFLIWKSSNSEPFGKFGQPFRADFIWIRNLRPGPLSGQADSDNPKTKQIRHYAAHGIRVVWAAGDDTWWTCDGYSEKRVQDDSQ
jgi:hypothetical protein